MNVQQHERIARIKKVSGYLHMCLTGMRYLLWAIWPLMVMLILFGNQGTFIIFDGASLDAAEVGFLPRVGMVICLSIFLFIASQLIFHFRELIRHFSNGDIFNKKAIGHAQKALWNGLLIYGFYVASLIVNWFYSATKSSPIVVPVNLDFIVALMFFGLMYVLLWALEIGCDLNEESELTI